MRWERRRAGGIWDTASGTLKARTLKSHSAVSNLPPGSALAARRLMERAGKEGRRRRKQALRLLLVTLSRGCVPVPPSSRRSPLDPPAPGHLLPRLPTGPGTPTPRPRAGDAPGTPGGSESLINRALIAWKTSHLSDAEGGAAWGPAWLPPPWGHGVIPPGRAGPSRCPRAGCRCLIHQDRGVTPCLGVRWHLGTGNLAPGTGAHRCPSPPSAAPAPSLASSFL